MEHETAILIIGILYVLFATSWWALFMGIMRLLKYSWRRKRMLFGRLCQNVNGCHALVGLTHLAYWWGLSGFYMGSAMPRQPETLMLLV